MRGWWALALAMLGVAALTVIGTTPPAPSGSDAPSSAFSAARAMVTVRAIGSLPHPAGSAQHERVRGYLMQRLRHLGFAVRAATAPLTPKGRVAVDLQSGKDVPSPQLVNVVATYPGSDPSLPAVLLMAHYDSVFGSPAAADDGAGVASALEAARAIISQGQPRRTLIVLLTDGEELGLLGAHGFFESDSDRNRVGVVVNMETRGGGGRTSMFETGNGNGAMMRLFGNAVHRPVGSSLSVFIYKNLPNDTDMTVSKAAGLPGFNFAFIGRPELYHSPAATPEALDQGALQDMGRQVLDLTRALLAAPQLPSRAPDLAFFDLFGLVFVSYPAWAGWLAFAVALAGFGYAAWRRPLRRAVAAGTLAVVSVVLVSGVLLYLFNRLSGDGPQVNYYDRLAAIPRLEAQALLVCLATWTGVTAWLGARRDESVPGFTLGAALPLLVLGVVAQALTPTAAYPVLLPLLLGGVAAALGRALPPVARAVQIAAGVVGIGYMLTLGHLLMEAVGPQLPMASAIPLALAALLAWPLTRIERRGPATLLALALVALAAGLALWVRLDPMAPTVATYSLDHPIKR